MGDGKKEKCFDKLSRSLGLEGETELAIAFTACLSRFPCGPLPTDYTYFSSLFSYISSSRFLF